MRIFLSRFIVKKEWKKSQGFANKGQRFPWMRERESVHSKSAFYSESSRHFEKSLLFVHRAGIKRAISHPPAEVEFSKFSRWSGGRGMKFRVFPLRKSSGHSRVGSSASAVSKSQISIRRINQIVPRNSSRGYCTDRTEEDYRNSCSGTRTSSSVFVEYRIITRLIISDI